MASLFTFNIYPYPLTNLSVSFNGTPTPHDFNDLGTYYQFLTDIMGTYTFSADGYDSNQATVSYNDAGTIIDITLTATTNYVSKLANGGNTYTIKDAEARASISSLATVATTGAYSDLSGTPTIPIVDQTYDATSTNAQAGIAVASGISNAVSGKVDKVSTASKVYGTDGSGNQTTYSVASAATASTVAYRGTGGVLQVGTPTANAHATTKKYVDDGLGAINGKIPAAATTSNQLADKDFVNSSINAIAAYYITSNVAGDAFATKAALTAGPYYHDGTARTPTENDYAIVAADETHNNACTRYSYTGSQWSFQYVVNDTPFTQAQINAINSGVTSTKVDNYDTHIADTTIHVTSTDKSNWNDAVHKTGDETIAGAKTFTTGTPIILKNSNQTVTNPTSTAYSNIHYKDKDNNTVVSLSSVTATWGVGLFNQINGKDGFSVLDLNNETGFKINTDTAALRNNPTEDTTTSKQIDTVGARNTKLQSYQPTLVSGTNIKTINSNSLLGSGNLTIDSLPSQSGNSGKFLTTNGTSASWIAIEEYTANEVETLWNSL